MKSISRTSFYVGVSAAALFSAAPFLAFAYPAAPVAVTMAPTFITEKSVQLNGQVNGNEMPDTYQWFEWGVVGRADIVYETPHHRFGSGNKLSNTNASLSGLAPNMQYFYRQVAQNGRGKDVGLTTYFTTKPLPVVITPPLVLQTNNPDSIEETSVVLNGYISPHGNSSVKWWFEWGETMTLENQTPKRATNGNSGSVKERLAGLTPGMTYYFRLVGENELGRIYGATKVFVMRGSLPVVVSEEPRSQSVPTPSYGDNVSRTVTTNGQKKTDSSGSGTFLDSFFGKNGTSAKTSATAEQDAVTSPEKTQTAAVGASTPLGTFWDTLSGKKTVEVVIEKVGPKKVPVHTAVEYQITYTYQLKTPATAARLKIILPGEVVYIGDNTENELLLEETAGPERTYILPIGELENGSTRTLSILGMTTGAANGEFPDARARLEFTDTNGAVQVVAAGSAIAAETKDSGSGASGSILPHSMLGWLFYLVIIIGSIIGVRKAKAYYVKRKEAIAQEEQRVARQSDPDTALQNGGVVA